MDIEKIFSRLNLLFTTLAAAFALFISFKFSAVEKKLSVQASQIANNKANIELQQSQTTFNREFKLKLLEQLKTALNTPAKDTLYIAVAVAFVRDMLADDPMKNTIMEVFENSKFIPHKLQEKLMIEREKEQIFETVENAIVPQNKVTTAETSNKIRIDVFYVENLNEKGNKDAADKIATKLNSNPNYNARSRQLPASVNLRSGYKVASNELRYDAGEEDNAQKLLGILNKDKDAQNNFQLRLTSNQTEGYLSVFIAN
jgi:hypothetical protein